MCTIKSETLINRINIKQKCEQLSTGELLTEDCCTHSVGEEVVTVLKFSSGRS